MPEAVIDDLEAVEIDGEERCAGHGWGVLGKEAIAVPPATATRATPGSKSRMETKITLVSR